MSTDQGLGIGGQGAAAARSMAARLAGGDGLAGLAKLELTDLERKQARWALARGTHSLRSFSGWGPGLAGTLIYLAGVWVANAYVGHSNTVILYLAYVVSALTGLVFTLGWSFRSLSRRLDAVVEIIEQQQ